MNETDYLAMQRRQYERRAAMARVEKNHIENEAVVGNYQMQEAFPYDENILRNFDGPYDSVFEYGCGPGRNLLRLSRRFALVAGADISKKNIDNARKFLGLNGVKDYRLFVTTGDNIPDDGHQYNLVFEVICFQHICSYNIRKKILADMVRICKPGGRVVLQMGFNDKTLPRSNHNTRFYADYYEDNFEVEDTNGWADCCVTNERQPIDDLKSLGLDPVGVWFTEGVNDINHDKWIWVSGRKP